MRLEIISKKEVGYYPNDHYLYELNNGSESFYIHTKSARKLWKYRVKFSQKHLDVLPENIDLSKVQISVLEIGDVFEIEFINEINEYGKNYIKKILN